MKVLIACQYADIHCLLTLVLARQNPETELLAAFTADEAIRACTVYGRELDGTIIWDYADSENSLAFDRFLLRHSHYCHGPIVASGPDPQTLGLLTSRGCTHAVPLEFCGTSQIPEYLQAPAILLNALG